MNYPYSKPHILVVDDDTRLRELLQTYLRDQGFAITVAVNARDARTKLALFRFDLMVLDVMMPGETGVELAHSLKVAENGAPHLPILLLTAMADTEDRINGLETGADDYLTKPFEPRELVLRIQAILRRTAIPASQKSYIQFGEFRFDLTNGKLQKNDEAIFLTTSELQLLKTLAENSPEAVTRTDLAKSLGVGDNERNVDVQITRLRKKIETDGSRPVYIKTVRGSGYALSAD